MRGHGAEKDLPVPDLPKAPEKRIDPPSRPVDGDINDAVSIAGQDPARVYVLADPNEHYCGVSAMQELGWEVERQRKDGPRMRGGQTAKDGDLITKFGQVLMSRPREIHEMFMKQAADVANQRAAAIGQPGGVDGVRGTTGKVAHNETSEYVTRG
jgi:hypothetical protein